MDAASLSDTSCEGLSFTQTFTAGDDQGGPAIFFGDVSGTTSGLNQTDNGQKIDVIVNYKKDAAVSGTFYIILATYNAETSNWSLTPLE